MKIISWNCNMAFRRKYQPIFALQPDIIILQECECPEKMKETIKPELYQQFLWYGDNQHKGVGIFNLTAGHMRIADEHDPRYRYVIPIELMHEQSIIKLYAIWAMDHKTIRHQSYVGQIWAALQHYEIKPSDRTILVGDFNSHVQWDHSRKQGNHSDVVSFLAEKNIHSLYHTCHDIRAGSEQDPTWYMYKDQSKPYHLDYCFASESLRGPQTSISMGQYEDWIKLSDHMPLMIELDIPKQSAVEPLVI